MDMGEGEGSESGVVHGGFVLVVAKGELYLPRYLWVVVAWRGAGVVLE